MRGVVVLALALLASAATAQEGGETFVVVDVQDVTGGVSLAEARAAVQPHERAFHRCGLPRGEAASIALTVARSGEVRVVSSPDLAAMDEPTRRYRRCLERVARSVSLPARDAASAFTIVVRLRFSE